MVELFQMALAKPLHFVVVALCMLSLATSAGLFEVKQAVAVINKQQEFDAYINDKVLNMSETLIRIDENVKHLKEQQGK